MVRVKLAFLLQPLSGAAFLGVVEKVNDCIDSN
jgi:hypothetical protein